MNKTGSLEWRAYVVEKGGPAGIQHSKYIEIQN